MNDKMCFTCKHQGKIRLGPHLDIIYHKGRGEHTYIHQCYNHSVELFKMGQRNFLEKYNPHFVGYDFLEKPTNTYNNFFPFTTFR